MQVHIQLRDMRLDRGLSQSQCGASRPLISLIERGQRLPGPRAVRRIAQALGISAEEAMAACKAHQPAKATSGRRARK